MAALPNLKVNMKKRKVNKRQIQGLLSESAFSPSEKNPFSIVVEMDDPNYSELKSLELIQEARVAFKGGSLKTYHDKMQQAIGLLALARAQRGAIQSS